MNTTFKPEIDTIDFKQYFKIIKKFWYLPVIVIIIALSIAWWKVKYAVPLYTVKGSIQVKDKSTYTYGSQSFLQGMNLFSSFKNISNEIAVINSYTMIESAVKEFNEPISIIAKGDIRDYEFYRDAPLVLDIDSSFIPANVPIYLTTLDNDNYLLSIAYGPIKPYDPLTFGYIDTILNPVNIVDKKVAYGEKIHLQMMQFSIEKRSPNYIFEPNQKYVITFQDLENQTYATKSKLKVYSAGDEASIINISSTGTIKKREVDFLNKLMEIYLRTGLEDKNLIATNTVAFIDNQLMRIADSLQFAENKLENFKVTNKVFSIEQVAGGAYEKMMELERQKSELELQNKYYEYLKTYVTADRPFNEIVAPTTVNIADPLLNKLVDELVTLYQERNALKFTSYDKSPAYQTIQLRIKAGKEALLENVNNIVNASLVALNDINRRIRENERKLSALPAQERNFINIQRRFTLNDNIYNYLLQKRAEASIAKASNSSDAIIIDNSRVRDAVLIYPRPMNNYSVAAVSSLIISVGFVLIYSFFDKKVSGRDDVEKNTNVPIIGGVGFLNNKSVVIENDNLHNMLTESFRSIRVNMQYMMADKKSVIIGVTSCIGGDGKSFTSLNLAKIYAISGKKTLLICADLRKKMHNEEYGIPEGAKGLSDYLVGMADFKEVFYAGITDNIKVVPSGGLPPNAAELLASEKMKDFFDKCRKEFDIIVVDSSPAGIVSDYLTLMPYIDINVYVVRIDHTPKEILPVLQRIKEANINNTHCVILNGLKRDSIYGGYGYAYGYGYDYGGQKKTK